MRLPAAAERGTPPAAGTPAASHASTCASTRDPRSAHPSGYNPHARSLGHWVAGTHRNGSLMHLVPSALQIWPVGLRRRGASVEVGAREGVRSRRACARRAFAAATITHTPSSWLIPTAHQTPHSSERPHSVVKVPHTSAAGHCVPATQGSVGAARARVLLAPGCGRGQSVRHARVRKQPAPRVQLPRPAHCRRRCWTGTPGRCGTCWGKQQRCPRRRRRRRTRCWSSRRAAA